MNTNRSLHWICLDIPVLFRSVQRQSSRIILSVSARWHVYRRPDALVSRVAFARGNREEVFDRISLASIVTGYSRGKRLEGKVTTATVHECNRFLSVSLDRMTDWAWCMKTLLVFALTPETFSYCHAFSHGKRISSFSPSLSLSRLRLASIHRCTYSLPPLLLLLLVLSIASAIITFSFSF